MFVFPLVYNWYNNKPWSVNGFDNYYNVLANLLGGALGAAATIWVLMRELKKRDEDAKRKEQRERPFFSIYYTDDAFKDKRYLPGRWRKDIADAPCVKKNSKLPKLPGFVMFPLTDSFACECKFSIFYGNVPQPYTIEDLGLMVKNQICVIPLCSLHPWKELSTVESFEIRIEYKTQRNEKLRHTLKYEASIKNPSLVQRIRYADMEETNVVVQRENGKPVEKPEREDFLIGTRDGGYKGPLFEWVP